MENIESNFGVEMAFTNQSTSFDAFDISNPILIKLRAQVRKHVGHFIKENDFLLEMNAGTGLDALYFSEKYNVRIHAIDISEGMLNQFEAKVQLKKLEGKITYEKLSFMNLSDVPYRNFDYVFSNFGGLNCTGNLNIVLSQLPTILKPGAIITLVIMPVICPWEFMWLFTRNYKKTFRRFHKNGSNAKIENDHFTTWHYSYSIIKKMLGKQFKPLKVESMSLLFPPPQSIKFAKQNPRLLKTLERLDKLFGSILPFNKWGDHYIASFQFQP